MDCNKTPAPQTTEISISQTTSAPNNTKFPYTTHSPHTSETPQTTGATSLASTDSPYTTGTPLSTEDHQTTQISNTTLTPQTQDTVVICYYSNWAYWRTGDFHISQTFCIHNYSQHKREKKNVHQRTIITFAYFRPHEKFISKYTSLCHI